jgi:AraC family transcriptional regulator of adaptative response/methylated-DNA-[protein]-cysteine methyltransferase
MDTTDNYRRIAHAIDFLRARHPDQAGLCELATHLGLSPSHTQRLFSRWVGISPKRFQQYLSVEYAKQCMARTGDLLQLSHASGLSGPGRLHDLFVNMEAMSPGEYRAVASGIGIHHGIGASPFGLAHIAYTTRGICHLGFVDDGCVDDIGAGLREQWPGADLVRDDQGAAAMLQRVFARPLDRAADGLTLWVSGTNFQIQVWRALLQLPFAGLISYSQLAAYLGRPRAARSVGSAVARNPVGFLIPCHRVLRGSGEFGTYHWGGGRKMAICAWEAANAKADAGDDVNHRSL